YIRKITRPQCWRAEYDELGVLGFRRSEVKETPDWTFNESTYDEGYPLIEFDDSGVINSQTVLGTIKQQQVLVEAGTSDVLHPYAETAGESEQVGSGSLSKAAAGGFHFVAYSATGLNPGQLGYEELFETINVNLSGTYRNLHVKEVKTVGLYPDGTQVYTSGTYTNSYYERGSFSTKISGGVLTIKVKRLYQVVRTNSKTTYNLTPLDVSFNVYGEQVSTTEESAEAAVPPEFNTTYYQVGAEVSDDMSLSLYGPRPGEPYRDPSIETLTQCTRVSEEIIKEKNKVWRVNIAIPLNPHVKRGQTVRVINTARSIDLTDVVKDVRHYYNLDTSEATTAIFFKAAEYSFVSSLKENLN
ncbi:MAG: hypothetical protein V3T30_02600, partial [Thermodesulfobacteriota bacterium]